MPVPYKGPPLEQLEIELKAYMRQLPYIKLSISRKKGENLNQVRVYVRVIRRNWNKPRRKGPYKVVLATQTAVQVEGSITWYHLNPCTKAPRVIE